MSMSSITSFIRTRIGWFLIFLFLFALMAVSVVMELPWVSWFDTALQSVAFALRSQWLSFFMLPLTYSGNWQAVTAICLILLLIPATRKYFGVPMTASAVLSVSLYQIIKHLIGRLRPDVALHLVHEGGFSFPSGHSLTSMMFWGIFILLIVHYRKTSYNRPLQAQQIGPAARISRGSMLRPQCKGLLADILICLAALYILLMGVSRVYVGVHWPSDVLAAWFLGLALLSPASKLIQKL